MRLASSSVWRRWPWPRRGRAPGREGLSLPRPPLAGLPSAQPGAPPLPSPSNLEKLGRFLLRGLRIGASTVSVVEVLRSDWTEGLTAGLAWLVFLQVERRLPPLLQEPEG